ncbi:MAG: 50S ribosomal protein L15 [Deltaproteobacteria bacterium]|nr:50S ribosomal protein L15 [Deltaproteobacteria bacterium]
MPESETTESNTEVPILSRLRAPVGAVHRKKRKGRGNASGLGTNAGKGQKGQKSQSPGHFSKLGFEGGQTPLHRRLPKVGFHNPFSKRVTALNIRDLARFESGSTVDLEVLAKAGLLKRGFDSVKILGKGELDKALTVRAHSFSTGARSKIEAAGGKAELLSDSKAPAASAEG